MKNLILVISLMFSFTECSKPNSKVHCDEKFFLCCNECSAICERTIKHKWEWGKCFAICNQPCREEFCTLARMVKMVDTEDLKSFANLRRGGSSPSVSIKG